MMLPDYTLPCLVTADCTRADLPAGATGRTAVRPYGCGDGVVGAHGGAPSRISAEERRSRSEDVVLLHYVMMNKKYVSASEIGGAADHRGVTINDNTERPHQALKRQMPAAFEARWRAQEQA